MLAHRIGAIAAAIAQSAVEALARQFFGLLFELLQSWRKWFRTFAVVVGASMAAVIGRQPRFGIGFSEQGDDSSELAFRI